MHPEFCSCDVTFGTNGQLKQLFTLAFLDGNNKGFNGGRAVLPNSQGWLFSMMFELCLPMFWGELFVTELN